MLHWLVAFIFCIIIVTIAVLYWSLLNSLHKPPFSQAWMRLSERQGELPKVTRASMEGAMPISNQSLSERPTYPLTWYPMLLLQLPSGMGVRKANWVLTRLNYGSKVIPTKYQRGLGLSPGQSLPRHWTNRRVTKRGDSGGVEEQG